MAHPQVLLDGQVRAFLNSKKCARTLKKEKTKLIDKSRQCRATSVFPLSVSAPQLLCDSTFLWFYSSIRIEGQPIYCWVQSRNPLLQAS